MGEDGSKSQEGAAAGDGMEQEGDDEEEDDDESAAVMMPIRGPLPPQDGSWASCIRLLDPVEGATVECLELGEFFFIFCFIFGEALLLPGAWILSVCSSFSGLGPLLTLVSGVVGCPLPWPYPGPNSFAVRGQDSVGSALFCAPSGSGAG